MKISKNLTFYFLFFILSFVLVSCEILELNVPETAGSNENIEVSTLVQYSEGPEDDIIQQVFIAAVPETWEVVSASLTGDGGNQVTFSSTPPSNHPFIEDDDSETCDLEAFITLENPDSDELEGLQVIYFLSEVFPEGTLMEGDQAELTVVFSQGQNPPTGEQLVFFGCAQIVDEAGVGCFADLGDEVSTEIAFINIINTQPAPLLDSKGLIGLVAAFLIIGYFSLRKKKRLSS